MNTAIAEKPRAHARTSIQTSLLITTAVTSIAGFLYGYDTGIISGALMLIAKEFHLGHQMQEMVASAILVGAVIGGLSCGAISERLGRRNTVALIALVYIVGALACSMAPTPALLIAARVLLGFAVGGSSQTVPVYISEIAPAMRRGNFVTCFNLAIGLGIVVASLVGYFLHNAWSWRSMISVAVIPAAILLASMPFFPKSPRWLMEMRRPHDAKHSLQRVRSEGDDIEGELRDIRRAAEQEHDKARGWAGLLQPWVRPATVAALGVAAFTQLSGIEMMIYYAPTILSGAGFGASASLLASVGLAVVYALMTGLGLLIVEKVGRRKLMLVMIPGAVVSLAILGTMFARGMATGPSAWVLVGCLLVYMIFNAGGIQVCGWLMGSEVYPLSVRAAGASAQSGMIWGADLAVTATGLSLVSLAGTSGTMWVYAGLNLLAFLFVLRFVPETAGLSLEDIEESLRSGHFKP
ncbi:sugar porter family MFS transporter [Silvibacterium sp.]|uniref:sugar porter family MFS transporter n=1 Tax=Silvibacterium sp. TaxID=1964179 RepID=UPI0039E371C8